jgi:ribosome-associated translation inhibitor RaiA
MATKATIITKNPFTEYTQLIDALYLIKQHLPQDEYRIEQLAKKLADLSITQEELQEVRHLVQKANQVLQQMEVEAQIEYEDHAEKFEQASHRVEQAIQKLDQQVDKLKEHMANSGQIAEEQDIREKLKGE